MPLSSALRAAAVSRTAYYSLARKDSILPKSVERLARVLGVSPSAFVVDETAAVTRLGEWRAQAEALHRRYPGSDRDVMFRTFQNLDLPPVQRLRRALIRAPRTRFTDEKLVFLRALRQAKVDFMIVGLSAAALQGAPMVTQAVDLWFRDVESPGVRKALRRVGGVVVPSIGLAPPMFAGEGVDLFDIVLTVHGIGSFDDEYAKALDISLGDFTVKVLPLARIIQSKRHLNRQKDRMALSALRVAARALADAGSKRSRPFA